MRRILLLDASGRKTGFRPSARWFRRPVWAVVMAGLLGLARTDGQEIDPNGPASTASQVRSSLGYSPEVLAALGVTANAQQAIIEASLSQVESLIVQNSNAPNEATSPLSESSEPQPENLTTPDDNAGMVNPLVPLASAQTVLVDALRAQLTPEQQAIHDRISQNRGLEPPLNLLGGLDDRQREALRAAQARRDSVLNNVRNWHRRATRKRAEVAFADEVQQALNPQQRMELRLFQDRLEASLGEAVNLELETYEAELGPAAAGQSRLPLRLLPTNLREGLLRVIDRSLRYMATFQQQASGRQVVPRPQADSGTRGFLGILDGKASRPPQAVAVAADRSR